MELHTLPGTDITTSRLGLGSAGLYRLPHREDREAVIRAALAAGVRHFDTAPMYGLGRAEGELARLLRSQRDEITLTTKFGIDPSALGRAVGRVQGPLRAVLSRRPGLQHKASESGSGPSGGSVGRLLYTATGYDAATAARSLHRSLRALRTDHVDIFALHEPMGATVADLAELIGYLDDQVRAGSILCWGVAGTLPPAGSDADRLLTHAAVVQQHDDVFEDPARVPVERAAITFGSLSRALPALLGHLAESRDAAAGWSERLGADPHDAGALAGVLLRAAVRRNPRGVVLFSTTRPERVHDAARALATPEDPDVAEALRTLVDEVATRQGLHRSGR